MSSSFVNRLRDYFSNLWTMSGTCWLEVAPYVPMGLLVSAYVLAESQGGHDRVPDMLRDIYP